jgi:hypothetical protein
MDNLHLVLSSNDFLLSQNEWNWFNGTFWALPKATCFEYWGHLGELWRPELQDVIRSQIELNQSYSKADHGVLIITKDSVLFGEYF